MLFALFGSLSTFAQVSFTYTSNGTFVVPVGVTEITVECWGGGGGGGRSTSTSLGRAGGGGGAYARSILTVTPNQSFNFIVGAGGGGGNISATAAAGGQTSFGGGLVVAVGGTGAGNNGNGPCPGGQSTACTYNVVAHSGGAGALGNTADRGAGGGGAGTNGPGGDASGITAGTGGADLGGNGAAGTNQAAGASGQAYGGGGAGGKALVALLGNNGGNGASGAVRITYIQPDCTGQPNAGTASINVAAGCDNASFNLSATGVTSVADYNGITYQWEQSTNGGISWTAIPGATNTTFTTTATVNTSYRLRTNCSISGQSNTTNVVTRTVNCWTLPQTTVVTTCGGTFFDSGGSGSNYGNNQNYTYTFFPANPGEVVTLTFTQFVTQSSNCGQDLDWLRIFNGNSTSAPAMHPTSLNCTAGFRTGNYPMPGLPFTFTSSAPDGSITVQFKSDGSTVAAGWAATIGCAAACSGTPNSGTATISAASGCPSSNFTLNVTGISTNPGITYQWQQAPSASGPWSDIPGATNSFFTTTSNVNVHYRLRSTCSNSNQSSFSSAVSRTIQGSCTCTNYAIFSATDAADTEISSVTVGTMTNNQNTCSTAAAGPGSIAGRYSNFTTTVTGPSVAQGSSVNFSLTQTSCGGNFTNFFQLYVDWNQNGVFETSERMYNQSPATSGTHTKTGSFTVPMTALPGITRMRIVNIEASSSTTNYAQTDYTYGETEDYCFTVLAPASDFKTSWFAMNVGDQEWCPGETRQVSVTVTNTGNLPWTDGGGNDFNIGVKWNFEPDYIVRVDAQNLGSGQSQTYTFNMTAPNTPGGTENLSFDVVKEGCFWFASNADGCALNSVGPGNIAFTSPQIKIKELPTDVSAGSNLQICPNTSAQLSASATSPTISASASLVYNESTGGTTLNSNPTTANESNCPIILAVNIPANATITGVNIAYQMEAVGALTFNSQQRSYLECISPGGIKEAAITAGSGSGTVQNYSRNNLTIANGVTGGGTILFRLHGFRTAEAFIITFPGCNDQTQRINNGTVVLTVNYTYSPDLSYNWNASPFLSALNTPNPNVNQPFGSQSYTVNVGANGCSVSSSVNVEVGNFGCTQLQPGDCGATNVSMDQNLRAINMNVPAYRFRITGPNNGGPGWNNDVFIFDSPNRAMRFALIPGSVWGSTYAVEVATGDGLGNFSPYGPACNVTLGGIPTSQLVAANCNTVNVNPGTNLLAVSVTSATGYRYRVNGANVNNVVVTKTMGGGAMRKLKMNEVVGIMQGETYSVEVAVRDAAGNWGNYGPICEVTLAGAPDFVINNNLEMLTNRTLSEAAFGASASHNPFTVDFGIQVLNANDSETIHVSIFDMSGKLIERNAIHPMDIENTRFGKNLASGMYMVEVRQGTHQAVIRQVKH